MKLKSLLESKQSLNETKFYAFFNNKKHEIDGKDLWDAKQKAITMLKVPKSKVGYLAIVNASEHDKGSFRYESVNEASEVKFNEIDQLKQKQIKAFENVIGGKHTAIFDGIHGMIVDIKKPSMGGSYRFDSADLKQLLALKIRWVEGDKDGVSIGF
jgi:hypothetical protein